MFSVKPNDFPTLRQGTREKHNSPTPRPPLISLGKREIALLVYLKNTSQERFNMRNYSTTFNIARSTVRDALDRLEKRGYVEHTDYGDWRITEKGLNHESIAKCGVGSPRWECRGGASLSQHYTTFFLPLTQKVSINQEILAKLNPERHHKIKLMNHEQEFLYFSDATIKFTPHKIIIRIHDITAGDVEETSFESMSKAMKYTQMLDAAGIKCEGMQLQSAHYARMNSLLGEFLSKIDDRYFLDLGDGKKFWIDKSTGEIEDETNSEDVRSRLDEFMQDMLKSGSKMSDIEKMKEVLGLIVQMKVLDFQQQRSAAVQNTSIERPDYFG